MKKVFICTLGVLLILSLTSCVNHQQIKFIEGTFFTDNGEQRLEIKYIDKDEFDKANGANVVEDHSINKAHNYFSINFYTREMNKWSLSTINGLYYSGNTTAEPCRYSFVDGDLYLDGMGWYGLNYMDNHYDFHKITPKYTLTFKYVSDSSNGLEENEDTNIYTYSFTYDYLHQITSDESDSMFTTITKDLPMTGGGYWTIGGYYSSLDRNEFILKDNVVDYNYTIYYTWVGGVANPPEI